MIISSLGDAGIRLQTKEAVVVIDPPAASTGLKVSRSSADIVAQTQVERRDLSNVTSPGLVITTPGEYELKQVFIYGLALASDPGKIHFRIEAEGLSLGHLGDLTGNLQNGELEALEGVDILFVPIGGKDTLSAEAAAKLISQIEPRVVVPIQYKITGLKIAYDDVAGFLKEMGSKDVQPEAKWKIAKKDLPAEETQVVLLSA